MKSVNISYLKNNLSAILDKLRSYGAITVLDRNVPVAVLLPATKGLQGMEGERLQALTRAGVIQSQGLPLTKEILEQKPPRLREAVDAVKMLISDRQQGL